MRHAERIKWLPEWNILSQATAQRCTVAPCGEISYNLFTQQHSWVQYNIINYTFFIDLFILYICYFHLCFVLFVAVIGKEKLQKHWVQKFSWRTLDRLASFLSTVYHHSLECTSFFFFFFPYGAPVCLGLQSKWNGDTASTTTDILPE